MLIGRTSSPDQSDVAQGELPEPAPHGPRAVAVDARERLEPLQRPRRAGPRERVGGRLEPREVAHEPEADVLRRVLRPPRRRPRAVPDAPHGEARELGPGDEGAYLLGRPVRDAPPPAAPGKVIDRRYVPDESRGPPERLALDRPHRALEERRVRRHNPLYRAHQRLRVPEHARGHLRRPRPVPPELLRGRGVPPHPHPLRVGGGRDEVGDGLDRLRSEGQVQKRDAAEIRLRQVRRHDGGEPPKQPREVTRGNDGGLILVRNGQVVDRPAYQPAVLVHAIGALRGDGFRIEGVEEGVRQDPDDVPSRATTTAERDSVVGLLRQVVQLGQRRRPPSARRLLRPRVAAGTGGRYVPEYPRQDRVDWGRRVASAVVRRVPRRGQDAAQGGGRGRRPAPVGERRGRGRRDAPLVVVARAPVDRRFVDIRPEARRRVQLVQQRRQHYHRTALFSFFAFACMPGALGRKQHERPSGVLRCERHRRGVCRVLMCPPVTRQVLPAVREVLRPRRLANLDAGSSNDTHLGMRPVRRGHRRGEGVLREPARVVLAEAPRVLELVALQPVQRPGRAVRLGKHGAVGSAIHLVEVPGALRHALHRYPQEALDFPTLVPPHNGAALLLALLRYDEPVRTVLRGDELLGSCSDVRLLLSNGEEDATQVVQSYRRHDYAAEPDVHRSGCHDRCLLLLQ
ncbi:hypothetical protein THAOC_09689 [Thalassiosira oceanica]|uniref:Uncharacterized protein n=1 Tax=Thalassiosira oceanica TaxID=159749 RepID=K0T700_THAOC|nr:hypothetical protein THAOC_09689 [Thalassiosira oceanica]|eukprot:EJK69091.1 hypothetical protein THAOC_09689 [Thalassiosira oceanica]